jgi:hypothetical protein
MKEQVKIVVGTKEVMNLTDSTAKVKIVFNDTFRSQQFKLSFSLYLFHLFPK